MCFFTSTICCLNFFQLQLGLLKECIVYIRYDALPTYQKECIGEAAFALKLTF